MQSVIIFHIAALAAASQNHPLYIDFLHFPHQNKILHHAIDCLIESSSTFDQQSSASSPSVSTGAATASSSVLNSSSPSATAAAAAAANVLSTPTLTTSSSTSTSSSSAHHKFGFANADEFDAAIRFLGLLCRRHAERQLDDAALLRMHFAHLPVDLQQSVLDVLCTRRHELQQLLLAEFNGRHRPLFQSLDWDVRWVLGSSSLATLRQQLATMVWQCRRQPELAHSNGNAREATTAADGTVFFEMNRQQVRDMIAQLADCAARMDRQAEERRSNGEKIGI